MIKLFLITLGGISLALGIVYLINPKEIYKLNENTAKFIPYQEIPEGLSSLSAKECGSCHVAIYVEWKQSLHRKAFIDPYFTAYLKKDKGDPTCLVCHTPLENQAPIILSSKSGDYSDIHVENNDRFDKKLQSEGVTCAACHVRDGVIYGPYKAEDMDAPHPVAYASEFREKSLCTKCHEVPSKDFSLMKNEGICSTGIESNTGPWAEKGYTCQDCHMPKTFRPLVPGYPKREGKKHTWPGGFSNHQLRKVFTFNAIVTDSKLEIEITNSGAGHKVPTGDTDRFIILEFSWLDITGKNKVLKSIEFKRQVVWQPIMFVWSDNRLAPGEGTKFSVPVPKNPGKLLVTGNYNIMSEWSLRRLQENYGLKIDQDSFWATERTFLKQKEILIQGGITY